MNCTSNRILHAPPELPVFQFQFLPLNNHTYSYCIFVLFCLRQNGLTLPLILLDRYCTHRLHAAHDYIILSVTPNQLQTKQNLILDLFPCPRYPGTHCTSIQSGLQMFVPTQENQIGIVRTQPKLLL